MRRQYCEEMTKRKGVEDADHLEPSIYKYILRHTRNDQLILVVVTLLSMPLIYLGLEIPKTIVNDALSSDAAGYQIFGFQFSQISYLLLLSLAFLFLVVTNGAIKYYVNVYRGVLGERMLKQFRLTLYRRLLRFPLPHFHRVSSSEIIPVVTSETEPLGGFIGESIGLPVFQGGLLITYIYFIFIQDVWLGIASIALYPIQMVLIPKLQRKVNDLGRQRVQAVRKLADRIGETANALPDIRINNAGALQRKDVDRRLAGIFDIRSEIFRRKFFIKFLNNFLGQLTPFFFYSIGGYLVIKGDLTLGALVAVLAAYKDIAPPWKELLKFYQTLEDIRVKYAQILLQFMPTNLLPPADDNQSKDAVIRFSQSIQGKNLNLSESHHIAGFKDLNFNLSLEQHIGIRAHGKDAAKELVMVLTGLDAPTSGSIEIDGRSISSYTEQTIGQNIGYSGPDSFIFNSSVRNNLFLGLPYDFNQDEISAQKDNSELGWAADPEFIENTQKVLKTVGLEKEVMGLALQSGLSPSSHANLMEKIVNARASVSERLENSQGSRLVERFDFDLYNTNLTLAENILFGTPLDNSYASDKLMKLKPVRALLKKAGLIEELVEIGANLADLMLELFQDVDEKSELFQQFSFIHYDELDYFKGLMVRYRENPAAISEEEHAKLVGLTLQLRPARHRLGLITIAIQQKALEVRKQVRRTLGEDNDEVQFLDSNKYQIGMSVRANLLFGEFVYSRRHLQEQVDDQLVDVLNELGIAEELEMVGLDFECGNAGAQLSPAFRSKLGLARAIMKEPDILIVDDALNVLDQDSQKMIYSSVAAHRKGKNLIWTFGKDSVPGVFDCVLDLGNGELVQCE